MKMWEDPIVKETRVARKELFARFDYDLSALCKCIRENEREHSDRVVNLRPRRSSSWRTGLLESTGPWRYERASSVGKAGWLIEESGDQSWRHAAPAIRLFYSAESVAVISDSATTTVIAMDICSLLLATFRRIQYESKRDLFFTACAPSARVQGQSTFTRRTVYGRHCYSRRGAINRKYAAVLVAQRLRSATQSSR